MRGGCLRSLLGLFCFFAEEDLWNPIKGLERLS